MFTLYFSVLEYVFLRQLVDLRRDAYLSELCLCAAAGAGGALLARMTLVSMYIYVCVCVCCRRWKGGGGQGGRHHRGDHRHALLSPQSLRAGGGLCRHPQHFSQDRWGAALLSSTFLSRGAVCMCVFPLCPSVYLCFPMRELCVFVCVPPDVCLCVCMCVCVCDVQTR